MNVAIKKSEFKNLSKFIYQKFGIHLPEAKTNLLLTRLQKNLVINNFKSFDEYYHYLLKDTSGDALSTLINQISTNFTYFYREPEHFDYYYKNILPGLSTLHAKDKFLKIWCAGCSSGEEAYLLAIMMTSYFGENYHLWDGGILATDISQKALDKAINGIYSKEAISKIPPMFRNSHFDAISKEEVKVDLRIQKEVTFRRFNLMNKVFPFKNKFDVIFCRNVMIYFDGPTRNELIDRFIDNLTIGGHLFIGHSETIGRDNSRLKYIRPSLYQRLN